MCFGKKLRETKNEKKNNVLVELIKNRLSDLKYEIEKMSEDEKKIEKRDKTMKVIKEILEFNKRIQFKEFKGLGLKILRPNQMLSRLPISLA